MNRINEQDTLCVASGRTIRRARNPPVVRVRAFFVGIDGTNQLTDGKYTTKRTAVVAGEILQSRDFLYVCVLRFLAPRNGRISPVGRLMLLRQIDPLFMP